MFLNVVIRWRFKKCQRINFTGEWLITGYKFITISSLAAGARLRLDAISAYNNTNYQPKVTIGSNVSLGCDVHIGCITSVYIGDDVLIGSRVTIIDHDHGVSRGCSIFDSAPFIPPRLRALSGKPIIINKNVHIGDGAIILKGVEIGEGSIVAAGAIVVKNVPISSMVVRNPAKVVKKFNPQTQSWEKVKTDQI